MSLTDYVTLGHSGLRVSPFCLGAMTFGEDWGWERRGTLLTPPPRNRVTKLS
jgi:aryl-alcohol dehydrogenase-like predicted oxidoreductase